VDFKGWWYDPQGKRCEPLTVRDEHSRYSWNCAGWPTPRPDGASVVLKRLFERYGLPTAIRSDNGTPSRHVKGRTGFEPVSAWWVALGIDLDVGDQVTRKTTAAMSGCIGTSA